jgi:[ribosomal protein S18]-alanine N-acetyltransferase
MDARCRIRAASTADLDAVARIERASFADPWSRRAFQVHLHDLFLVADRDGTVAGYVIGRVTGAEGEILNIAVDPSRRTNGLGRALLDASLDALRAAGVESVFLEVRVSNTAARRLYEAGGFTEIGRRRGYYDRPVEDAVVMRVFTG